MFLDSRVNFVDQWQLALWHEFPNCHGKWEWQIDENQNSTSFVVNTVCYQNRFYQYICMCLSTLSRQLVRTWHCEYSILCIGDRATNSSSGSSNRKYSMQHASLWRRVRRYCGPQKNALRTRYADVITDEDYCIVRTYDLLKTSKLEHENHESQESISMAITVFTPMSVICFECSLECIPKQLKEFKSDESI